MMGPEMVSAITQEGAYVARGSVARFRKLKEYIKKALENQMAMRGFLLCRSPIHLPHQLAHQCRKNLGVCREENDTTVSSRANLKRPCG